MTHINVEVVWVTLDVQEVVTVALPAGATIADALASSRLCEAYGLDPSTLGFALRGRPATASTALSPGDRVGITRPLAADPREVRRRRAIAAPPTKTTASRRARRGR